jgi:ankyrin repeat protein
VMLLLSVSCWVLCVELGSFLEVRMSFDRLLLNAVERGDAARVGLLLAGGANPNAKRVGSGRTALAVALWGGHSECVGLLLDSGASVGDARLCLRREVVGCVRRSEQGALDGVRCLLGFDVLDARWWGSVVEGLVAVPSGDYFVNEGEFRLVGVVLRLLLVDGRVPDLVHLVCASANPVLIRGLFEGGGVDVSELVGGGEFVPEGFQFDSLTVFESLLFGRFAFRSFAGDGLVALLRAVPLVGLEERRRFVSSFLLRPHEVLLSKVVSWFHGEREVFPEDVIGWGFGPLGYGLHLSHGQLDGLGHLLDLGFDPNAGVCGGEFRLLDGLLLTVSSGSLSVAQLRRVLAGVGLLVGAGGRLSGVEGWFGVVRGFFALGGLFGVSKRNFSLLAFDEILNVSKLLVEAGYDLNERDSNGNTFLHLLAREGVNPQFENYVRELIPLGLNINAVNAQGYSPMQVARKTGARAKTFASALIACGAKKRVSSTPSPVGLKTTTTPTAAFDEVDDAWKLGRSADQLMLF